MTPADRNLVRNIALSILAPGSGIYRDGVREALAVVDAETAMALNAPRSPAPVDDAHERIDDHADYIEGILGWLDKIDPKLPPDWRRKSGMDFLLGQPCVQRSSGNVFRDLGRPDSDAKFEAAKESAKGLPDSPDEAGLVREAIWMAIARVDGVPTAAATAATAEVIHTLYGFGVDLRQKIDEIERDDTDDMATMRHIRQAHRPLLDALAAQPVGLFAQLTPEQQQHALEYTGNELIGPRCSPAPVDTVVAEVRADLLARSNAEAVARDVLARAAVGLRKYGVPLEDAPLSRAQTIRHAYEETLDLACYLMRDMQMEADREATPQPDLATQLDWHEERVDLPPAQLNRNFCKVIQDTPTAAPVEPPHAAAPFLAPLAPEPAEAVLGRAGDALAWDGQQLPVWVEYKPGTRHPYGDAAYHVAAHETPDGMARLFPSREAACVWLAAMGKVPV